MLPSRPVSTNVTIVLATYNGERYLPAQLQSYLDQTLQPAALIASDDGSTDGTLALLQDFAARAPFPVIVRRNPVQLGYGENFLSACHSVQTDLIAFSDQDDVWFPEKLARSVAPFRDPETALVVHSATLIDADGHEPGHYQRGAENDRRIPPLSLDPWGFFAGFSMTVRRDLLDVIPAAERGPDSNEPARAAAHDRWVYFLASCLGDIVLLSAPLAYYRQHGRNLFGGDRSSGLQRALAVLRSQDALGKRAAHYRAIAEQRIDLLRAATSRHPELAAKLDRAAQFWLEVEHSERNRLDFYRRSSSLARLRDLADNLRNGTYPHVHDGTMRRQAIARDALYLLTSPRR